MYSSSLSRRVTQLYRLSGAPSIGQSPTQAGSLEQPSGFEELTSANGLALHPSPSLPYSPLPMASWDRASGRHSYIQFYLRLCSHATLQKHDLVFLCLHFYFQPCEQHLFLSALCLCWGCFWWICPHQLLCNGRHSVMLSSNETGCVLLSINNK